MVSDTSKPAGAVITRLADNPVPATVNVCSTDVEPAQVVKGEKVPETVIAGTTSLSYAPISAGFAAVSGRMFPSISMAGAPVLVPALIAGEPGCKCRFEVLINKGSVFLLPIPA